jgi:hypothetical protein
MSARADGRTTSTSISALILLSVMVCAFFFRSWFATSVMPPPQRMQGETTQAFRYTGMVSSGEGIPAVDSLVMHPDGMRTGENSIFEEYIAGGIHGLVGGDISGFLRFFCIAFPLLVIPGLYLWMKGTGVPGREALLGASAYGILLPALLRTRGESLYRETVALPLLVWTGWAVDSSLRSKETGPATVAAPILLFASLAAWKVTAFLSAALFIYLLLRQCRRGDVPVKAAAGLSLAQILASVILSHMRHDMAILSAATVLAAFLLLSLFEFRGRRILPGVALVSAAVCALVFSGSTGHVGAVILAKLRFLFSHPSDPSMLTPDARLFWVSGYTSPSPAEMLLLFSVPAVAAAFGLRRFRELCSGSVLFWLLPLSLAGYLFFDRLHVFLAVALIPPLALACRRLPAAAAVMAALVMQSALVVPIAGLIGDAGLEFRDGGSLLGDGELDSMLEWTASSTGENEAFMCFWHLSGLISAYAHRPVVTHTFFENESNRQTIIEFARQTFASEDSLAAFMRRHDADLYVYQADFLLDRSSQGLLYLAGLTDVPDNCAALRMHFAPETLDSLALVYQGPSLRVFRMGGTPAGFPALPLYRMRYFHVLGDYDTARAALAAPEPVARELAWRGREQGDPHMVSAAMALACGSGMDPADVIGILQELAMSYFGGDYGIEYLEEDFLLYLHHYGPDPALRLDLARLLASEGLIDRAVIQYTIVLQEDPECTEASEELDRLTGSDGKV